MLLNGYRLEDELSRTKAQDIPRSIGKATNASHEKTIIEQVLKNALPITMPPAKSRSSKDRKLHVSR